MRDERSLSCGSGQGTPSMWEQCESQIRVTEETPEGFLQGWDMICLPLPLFEVRQRGKKEANEEANEIIR